MKTVSRKTKRNIKSRDCRKFTMVELLVVISIIMILASLLFPSLGKAKELARASECQGHLKQFGLAAAEYSNDYNEYTLTYTNTGNYSWCYSIGPYLNMGETATEINNNFCNKNTIYTCSSHRWREGTNKKVKGYYGRCYIINYHFVSACATDYFNDGKILPKLSVIKYPSLLIYLIESDVGSYANSGATYKLYGDPASAWQLSDGGYFIESNWHNGYPNQLRVDGHVDKTKWGKLPAHNDMPEGPKVWKIFGEHYIDR